MRTICTLLLVALAGSAALAEDSWPQFRGGKAAGVAEASGLPDSWDATKNVMWSAEVPGRGWSSPVVWKDRIFITAVVSDKTALPRKGLYIMDVFGKVPAGEHRWVVCCLDGRSAKVLWEKTAQEGRPTGPIHVKNTYASETPVTDGRRVYAYFGNHGLFCYDFDGKQVWSCKLASFKTKLGWGTAASPVLHKDRLYVVHDNEEQSFLVAVDTASGKEVWRVPRDEKSNWATPFIWENDQRTEIVTCGCGKVRSYDLDGKLLWELGGMSSIVIPTPSAAHGLLYVSSGYVGDGKRRPVFAIRPGASGDISLGDGETSNKHIAWCHRLAGPYHPSPIVYGDHLYVLYDRGLLSCYDARTGKPVYEKQRLPATEFTSSPWAYRGKLFCQSEDGETFVVQTGPEFKVLGRNRLEEMTLATPAIAGDSLIIRTASKVYRIRQR